MGWARCRWVYPGHDVVDLGPGTPRDHAQEAGHEALEPVELVELVAQPQTHVGGDLLIAAVAGVQFTGRVLADDSAQAALSRRCGCPRRCRPPTLVLDLEQACLDLLELVLGQAAGLCVCAGEGDGAEDVLLMEDFVEGQGLAVLLHEGVEAAC